MAEGEIFFKVNVETGDTSALSKLQTSFAGATTAAHGTEKGVHDLRAEILELAKANGSAGAAAKLFEQIHHKLEATITTGSSRFRELKNEVKLYSDIAASAGLKSPVGAQAAKHAQDAANELKHLNAEMKLVTSNTAGLEFASSFAKGIAGGFEVAAASAALFGVKNEAVEKTLKQLVAVQTLVNGVTEVFNALRGKTGLIAEAGIIREKALILLDKSALGQKAALSAMSTRQLAAESALVAVKATEGVTDEAVAIAEAELTAAKLADAGATTFLTTVTGALGAAVKFALGPIGLLLIAVSAIYFLYQSVTGATEEYTKAIEENAKENEKFKEGIRKSSNEIAAQQDKIDVLNGTLTEHGAKQNEARRKFNDEGDKISAEYLEALKKANKELEHFEDAKNARITEINKQFQKKNTDNQLKFANERLILSKESAEESEKAIAAANEKAAKDRLAMSAEQRKIEFDRAMGDIQTFEDAQIAAAQGNEEKVLQAKIQADKMRSAETRSYYQREVDAAKVGTIERLKAEDAMFKAISATDKKESQDRLALQEKYRKDLIELNKEYDAMVLANMPEGVKKEIAQIDKRYADLLEKEKFNLISNDAEIRKTAQKLVDEAGVTKKQDTEKAVAKGDTRATDAQIATNKILLALKTTGFAEQRELIQDNANNEINEAGKLYELNRKGEMGEVEALRRFNATKAQINQNALEAQREVTKKQIDNTSEAITAGFAIINAVNDATAQDFDEQITAQEKRVQDARSVADRGNAEVYKQEQERLDKLQKQKEEAADRAEAIAQVQVVANAAIAVSQAATYPFPANIIAIASTIAALIAGLSKAKSLSLAEGEVDIQGPGTTTSDSIRANLSRGESVLTAQTTQDYKPTILAMHEGRIDAGLLNRFVGDPEMQSLFANNAMMVAMPVGLNQAAGGMTKEDFADVVAGIPAPSVTIHTQHITEGGIYETHEKISRRKALTAKHARNGK